MYIQFVSKQSYFIFLNNWTGHGKNIGNFFEKISTQNNLNVKYCETCLHTVICAIKAFPLASPKV